MKLWLYLCAMHLLFLSDSLNVVPERVTDLESGIAVLKNNRSLPVVDRALIESFESEMSSIYKHINSLTPEEIESLQKEVGVELKRAQPDMARAAYVTKLLEESNKNISQQRCLEISQSSGIFHLVMLIELAETFKRYKPSHPTVQKICAIKKIMDDLFADKSIVSSYVGVRVAMLEHLHAILDGGVNLHYRRKAFESICVQQANRRFQEPEPWVLKSLYDWSLLGIIAEVSKGVPLFFSWKARVEDALRRAFVILLDLSKTGELKVFFEEFLVNINDQTLDRDQGFSGLQKYWMSAAVDISESCPNSWQNFVDESVNPDTLLWRFMTEYGFKRLPVFETYFRYYMDKNDSVINFILEGDDYKNPLTKIQFWYDELFLKNIVAAMLYDKAFTQDRSGLFLTTGQFSYLFTEYFTLGASNFFITRMAKNLGVPAKEVFQTVDNYSCGILSYPSLKLLIRSMLLSPSMPYNSFGYSDSFLFSNFSYGEDLLTGGSVTRSLPWRIGYKGLVPRTFEEQVAKMSSYILAKGASKTLIKYALKKGSKKCTKVLGKTFDCTVFKILPKATADTCKKFLHAVTKILAMKYVFDLEFNTENLQLFSKTQENDASMKMLKPSLNAMLFFLGDTRMMYQNPDEETLNNIFAEHFSNLIAEKVAFYGENLVPPLPQPNGFWQKFGRCLFKSLWCCGKGIQISSYITIFYVYNIFREYLVSARKIASIINDSTLSDIEKKNALEFELNVVRLTKEELVVAKSLAPEMLYNSLYEQKGIVYSLDKFLLKAI